MIGINRRLDWLNVDFCPWANRYVYWMKRPMGWVVAGVASTVLLGIYVSNQAFYALGAIASMGIIGCLWPWFSMRLIQAEMEWGQEHCDEGCAVETTLRIKNSNLFSTYGVQLQDISSPGQVEPDLQRERVWASLRSIQGCTDSVFEWSSRFNRRGIYPERCLMVGSAFPFGLWYSVQRVKIKRAIVVWPTRYSLVDSPQKSSTSNPGIGSFHDRGGNDGDRLGCRAFRAGDSLRKVNWSLSAKRGELIVHEHQTANSQSAVLWIDESSFAEADLDSLDFLVRVVASFGTQLSLHGWDLRVPSSGNWRSVGNDSASRSEWYNELSTWKPTADGRGGPALDSAYHQMRIMFVNADSFEAGSTNCDSHRAIVVVIGRSREQVERLGQIPNVIALSSWGDAESEVQAAWRVICRTHHEGRRSIC